MFCQSESVSRFASWHVIVCHRDADWVVLAEDGETVLRFLCDSCRRHEGLPLPMYDVDDDVAIVLGELDDDAAGDTTHRVERAEEEEE